MNLLDEDYDDFCRGDRAGRGASHAFDQEAFLAGKLSPVFFGTALGNFGVREMLDDFRYLGTCPPESGDRWSGRFAARKQVSVALCSRYRPIWTRAIGTGLPLCGLCSGSYIKGMKMNHVRIGKDVKIADAVTFKAGERVLVEEAVSGDIIGLHNHGTIQIGDTFTEGEALQFTGIPHFAPELFRRIRLRRPAEVQAAAEGLAAAVRGGFHSGLRAAQLIATWWSARLGSCSLMWWPTG